MAGATIAETARAAHGASGILFPRMTEPRIPEARDDDPEEVADKLSIASAMWARGDRADALTWLRRAAESASDADADMRALELAKAASELAPHVSASVAPAAAAPAAKPPAAPPPKPSAAPPPKPSIAPKPATAAPPKPPTAKPMPPGSRPPGGKLPPLPPIRPLGSAPAAPAKPAVQPVPQRMPSMITSATGAMTASGSIEREELPPVDEASKHMPWDEQQGDDEPTRQIAIGSADATFDGETTRTYEQAEPEPAPVETPSLRDNGPATVEAQELPLSVGLRVRLIVEGGRIVAEPDRGQAGTLAIVVPLSGDDDLRTVFRR